MLNHIEKQICSLYI